MNATSSSRRRFLRIAGGGAVILAAGAGAWVATRTPTGALKPWRVDHPANADPRIRALAYAILAPSPHNMQSWRVDLSEDRAATLYADPAKLLPETDPFSRQITIGFGCFLETLRVAAAEAGMAAEIAPFPQGADPRALDDRPIARIAFRDGAEKDPLFAQILRRRTVKEPYDMANPPSAAALDAIAAAAATPGVDIRATTDPGKTAAIRDLFWRGHRLEATTARVFQESVDTMRIGRAEIEAAPDGIALSGAFFEALSLAGVLTREALSDPQSDGFRQGLEIYRAMLAATPAALWMTSAGNDRETQLAAGRAWVRAQLKGAELGVDLHPVSQALQEYPEMAALYAEARDLFEAPAVGVVQMAARAGRGPATGPSPRWPLEAKVIDRGA